MEFERMIEEKGLSKQRSHFWCRKAVDFSRL